MSNVLFFLILFNSSIDTCNIHSTPTSYDSIVSYHSLGKRQKLFFNKEKERISEYFIKIKVLSKKDGRKILSSLELDNSYDNFFISSSMVDFGIAFYKDGKVVNFFSFNSKDFNFSSSIEFSPLGRMRISSGSPDYFLNPILTRSTIKMLLNKINK